MTTRINIVVNDDGLLARNKEQAAANRQASVQQRESNRVTKEAERQLTASRRARGADPLTGRPAVTPGVPSPMSLPPSRRSLPNEQEPAANRFPRTPSWGCAWFYKSEVNYVPAQVKNALVEIFRSTHDTRLEFYSGNGEKYLNVLLGESVFPVYFIVPVRKDTFILVYLDQDIFGERRSFCFLLGFNVARQISSPEGIEALYDDSPRLNTLPTSSELDWVKPVGLGECTANAWTLRIYPDQTPGFITGGPSVLDLMLGTIEGKLEKARLREPSVITTDLTSFDGWGEQTCLEPELHLARGGSQFEFTYVPSSYTLLKNGTKTPLYCMYLDGFVRSKKGLMVKANEFRGESATSIGLNANLLSADFRAERIHADFAARDIHCIVFVQNMFYQLQEGPLEYTAAFPIESPFTESSRPVTRQQVGDWARSYMKGRWEAWRAVNPNRPFYMIFPDSASLLPVPEGFDGQVIMGYDNLYSKLDVGLWREPALCYRARGSVFMSNTLFGTTYQPVIDQVFEERRWVGHSVASRPNSVTNSISNEDWILPFYPAVPLGNYNSGLEDLNTVQCLLCNSMNTDWTEDLVQYGFSAGDLV